MLLSRYPRRIKKNGLIQTYFYKSARLFSMMYGPLWISTSLLTSQFLWILGKEAWTWMYSTLLTRHGSGRFIHVGLQLLNDMLSIFDSTMDTSGKIYDALFKIYTKMLPTISRQWHDKHPGMCFFFNHHQTFSFYFEKAGKELKRMQRLLRGIQTESAPTTMGTC